MPLEIPIIREFATKIASSIRHSAKDKIVLLSFLGQFPPSESELTDVQKCQISIFNTYLTYPAQYVYKYAILHLLSSKYSIELNKKRIVPYADVVEFIATPKLKVEEFYDLSKDASVIQLFEAIKDNGFKCIVYVHTGFGRAEVSWYDPFLDLISIYYIEDSGGYSIRNHDDMIVQWYSAKRLGYL
jgi:hypothetical protein